MPADIDDGIVDIGACLKFVDVETDWENGNQGNSIRNHHGRAFASAVITTEKTDSSGDARNNCAYSNTAHPIRHAHAIGKDRGLHEESIMPKHGCGISEIKINI